ncbi:MAG TPA: alanine--tRNA ligase, partial [Terriglobia bacterium]|nr:alanine--tRNA ligase [Terriglobia bacterium]
MNSNEIRRRFLQFFADRGHAIVKSSSLIPAEDPTLLFVNAGMNQFKDVFLGREQRSYTTATSCQKCVRAGGKHNDLDNVGHTRRHQTFFEMLGNFSFGAYFKKEAIDYAWTLLTREFKLPIDKLWVTIFREDDDAAKFWISGPGVARDRILRLDEKDNFWQMGDTGPCGPCSEIHYDLGPAASELGHTNCAFPCDCGRYVEIWNLVFMQFDRDSEGLLWPLPKPSIDTGMGLERIASVLQGKISNYETDLLRPIIDEACQLFNVEYGGAASSDVSLRIIADHVRAATFLISDGVIPSNEGRGYVLRKIMRRGIRQGTLLGYKEPFLYTLSGYVVEMMKEAYPELIHTREYVARVIKTEEERFAAMVTVGLQRLEQTIHQLVNSGKDVIPGIEIFKLYDTYGFPLDFTKEIADEKSMRLDMDGFEAELEKQRERARQSWRGDETAVSPVYEKFVEKGGTPFLGYEAIRST